jgi:biotin carboxyl carrier protein
MINEFVFEDQLIETRAEVAGNGLEVTIGDKKYRLDEIAAGKYRVACDGQADVVACVVQNGKAYIDLNGLQIELRIPSEENGTAAGLGMAGEKDKVYAPMPGKVVKLLVKEGDEVAHKQPLVIVEAMKMEHQVNALADAVVKKINFSDGDQVDTETPIIELEIKE